MFYLVEHYELNGYVTAFVFQSRLVSGEDVLRKWDMYNGKFSTKYRIQHDTTNKDGEFDCYMFLFWMGKFWSWLMPTKR